MTFYFFKKGSNNMTFYELEIWYYGKHWCSYFFKEKENAEPFIRKRILELIEKRKKEYDNDIKLYNHYYDSWEQLAEELAKEDEIEEIFYLKKRSFED